MRKRVLWLVLFAAACGKKEPPAPEPAAAPPPQQPAVEPPPPAPPAPSDEERKRKRAELEAKVKELEATKKALLARHEKEREGLPAPSKLRDSYLQAIRDATKKEADLERMRQRQQELKGLAESAARGKLKELREERAKVDERRRAIQDAWRQSMEDASQGAVEESPFKKDLDTVRAVKKQWLLATPAARRGTAKESERRIISDGFRGWLAESTDRKRVVADILGLPLAPKGKTPDTYDFTDLKFFVLLEVMEERLERQNIAVEKKELSENRVKLDAIQKELDAIDEKIREQMLAGGEELQEYEDLVDRLPRVQDSASYLSTRVAELRAVLKQLDETKERQAREETEADAALDKARKELQALGR
jgi:hypothetical protein